MVLLNEKFKADVTVPAQASWTQFGLYHNAMDFPMAYF